MLENCTFCLEKTSLIKSHIIPKFVLKWHKEARQGPIRNTSNINQRIQDYDKPYLLCKECDNSFSKWENLFCKNLFKPYQDNTFSPYNLNYTDWLLKFSTSLSWKVLALTKKENNLISFSDLQKKQIDKALQTWQRFLINQSSTPAEFEQHIILLDGIRESSMKPPLFLNRYLLEAIHFDVLLHETAIISYTKFLKFIFIGIIQIKNKSEWKINKIHIKEGKIDTLKTFNIPEILFNYILEQANEIEKSFDGLSSDQYDKINCNINNNFNEYVKSNAFKGMLLDNS